MTDYVPMNMSIPLQLAALTTVRLATESLMEHLRHRNDPEREGYCYCGQPTAECSHFRRDWTPDLPLNTWMALQSLRELRRLEVSADICMTPIVARLRHVGAPWSDIGDALSITRQAAQARFGKACQP